MKLFVAALAVLLIPAVASADTVIISFAGTGNNLGTSSATFSGVTATGWYSPTSDVAGSLGAFPYELANLFQRDEPNDHGLGVCNPNESADQSAGATCGGGDINEVDNMDNSELIVLTKPDGTTWVSIQLSSVDCNQNAFCNTPEEGAICFLNNADPNIGSGPCIFYSASVGGDIEPVILIPEAFANAVAILIVPGFGSDHHNNDILVAGVTIQVPEPGTLALLGLGLGALAVIRRRK